MIKSDFKIFSFIVLLCICASSAFSFRLYVSPQGKDSNTGTEDSPLASLSGARDRIRRLRQDGKPENIQVMIASGNYLMKEPLLLTAEDGGAANTTVTYMASPGAKPVFYGGTPISGFTKVNDRLWRVFIPETQRSSRNFEQLYVNDSRAMRARFPNKGFFKPKAVTETVTRKGEEGTADFAVQKIMLLPNQATLFNKIPETDLENSVITFYHKWDNTRKRMIRYSLKDTAFYTAGRAMESWNKLDEKTQFTIENMKAALDTAGEWYLEKTGYLYYIPREGESISKTTCYVPVQDKFIVISGSNDKRAANIHFENLAFKVAGYKMPQEGNDPIQAAASIEATVMIDFASGIQFTNCEIAHTGSNAIWFRKACTDGLIEHCYLHDLGAGAVKIGEIRISEGTDNTRHIIVNNNIIRNGGHVFPCAVAMIVFTGSDNELTHNEVADFKYSGVSVGWVWGYKESTAKHNKVEFNHIHHLGWGGLSDMGGVYTLAPSEGTTVSNNVVHHIYSATYGGWGLYTDEGSTGIVMENNLVYACKSAAFHQHYGKDNIIRNNIFYNQIRAQLEASKVESHLGFTFTNNIIYYSQGNLAGINWDKCNMQADYNSYWDTRTKDIIVARLPFTEWQKTGKDEHSIIADPKFVDAANLNFKIKNKSLISKIRFKPFDYTQAGVYGTSSWKKLAVFDLKRTMEFDKMVKENEHNQAN